MTATLTRAQVEALCAHTRALITDAATGNTHGMATRLLAIAAGCGRSFDAQTLLQGCEERSAWAWRQKWPVGWSDDEMAELMVSVGALTDAEARLVDLFND